MGALFGVTLNWIFTALAQVGLVLLLFLVGLEFDFSHLRASGPSAIAISAIGVALPSGLGVGAAFVMHGALGQSGGENGVPEFFGFALFMGTAMSITALPILGRMMLEMGITRTRLGTITISAAAVDDAFGWILLAAVSALVGGAFAWAARCSWWPRRSASRS
jgi:Kef-type K+ transport system membrane component KefB